MRPPFPAISSCRTTTTTSTVTVTAQPTIVTATAVVGQTSVVTLGQTLTTVVTTIIDTATVVQNTEVDVTNTIVSAVTADPEITLRKRAATTTTSANTGTCAATTNAPSSVPTYASACSGTVRYSSACSCAGITGTTTTLPQSTSTATTTSTVTYTPTSTAVQTVTSVAFVSTTQTTFVPATLETTATTVTQLSPTTVTTTVVVPSTVSVAQPCSTEYRLIVADGERAGQTIAIEDLDTEDGDGYLGFVFPSSSTDEHWTINDDSTLHNVGSLSNYAWVSKNSYDVADILLTTPEAAKSRGIFTLRCVVAKGGQNVPGALGLLACFQHNNVRANIEYCGDNGVKQSPFTTAKDAQGNSCTAVNIAVVPAC